MAIYGWDTIKEAERYKAARQKVLAREGMPALMRGRNPNRSDPLAEVVSPGGSLSSEKSKEIKGR